MLSGFAWRGRARGGGREENAADAADTERPRAAPAPDHTAWRTSDAAKALTPYRRAVYELTSLIPAGHVATYGTLAVLLAAAGATPSPRAVGTALHHNPFAPAVPCHRVVGSGGRGGGAAGCADLRIGGFNGAGQDSGADDIRRKISLLASEGVPFDGVSMKLTASSKLLPAGAVEWTPDDFPLDAVNAVRATLALAPLTPPRARGGAPTAPRAAPPASTPSVSGIKRKRSGVSDAGSSEDASVRAPLAAEGATGAAVREACRSGALTGHTSGLAPGYAQANLVIVPAEHAFDFLAFCVRNPKPCPLLEVTDVGSWGAKAIAPGSDIRTDLPAYRVYRNGVLSETVSDIKHLWPGEASPAKRARGSSGAAASAVGGPDARNDWVAFLLGCSFSFEEALLEAGVPVRQLQEEAGSCGSPSAKPPTGMAANPKNVPMYKTCVPTTPAGIFHGPLVVSMRPMTPKQAEEATAVTQRFPRVHGKPVFAGPGNKLGIKDMSAPDYGDAVTIHKGEIPVFWACGVTPQAALLNAKLPIAITHAPGHMFVSDKKNSGLAGYTELDVTPFLK